MLIRSQDKRVITEDLNLIIKITVDGYQIENTKAKLGVYSTREKAIKVLDMILENYGRIHASNLLLGNTVEDLKEVLTKIDVNVGAGMMDKLIDGCVKMYIFQMPSDEEVEG